jgi:hypothetical protein
VLPSLVSLRTKWADSLIPKIAIHAMMPSMLAARKLAQFDDGKHVPATVAAISDAVRWAEEMKKSCAKWTGAGPKTERCPIDPVPAHHLHLESW